MADSSAADDADVPPPSLSEAFAAAIDLVESSPVVAVAQLTKLQMQVADASLFSTNETLEDVSTSSLPLLAVEHHLAMALLNSPSPSSLERRDNVVRASELFHAFLRKMEDLTLMDPDLLKDYHAVLDREENGDGGGMPMRGGAMTAGQAREAKIARFRRKKAAREEIGRLDALRKRRERMGAEQTEEMDGHDDESLRRVAATTGLTSCAVESLDELESAAREVDMLKMAVEMERRKGEMERHRSGAPDQEQNALAHGSHQGPPHPNHTSNKPLEVTRITQDPTTGKLQMTREQIKSNVFRPGWNQPTMTLKELGDRERAAAIERSERQKEAEEASKNQPRRYEQLMRDGMEDNADLVDQSAKLDREWDDFKDANPRGSGNKMGDVGDRNF